MLIPLFNLFVLFVFEGQEGVLEWAPHVAVGDVALEVGGGKLGKLVVGDVFVEVVCKWGHHVTQELHLASRQILITTRTVTEEIAECVI